MAPEPTKPDSTTTTDGEKHKKLDQEVRELISALTSRLGSIQRSQKSGSSTSAHNQDEDDQGVRIITLAGSNVGATMRGETDQKPQDLSLSDQEDFATYVNSNFQAINNSIMMGGSYKTNDPGVHLDVSDYNDENNKRHKKGRKHKRASSKSDHHIEHDDGDETSSDDE